MCSRLSTWQSSGSTPRKAWRSQVRLKAADTGLTYSGWHMSSVQLLSPFRLMEHVTYVWQLLWRGPAPAAGCCRGAGPGGIGQARSWASSCRLGRGPCSGRYVGNRHAACSIELLPQSFGAFSEHSQPTPGRLVMQHMAAETRVIIQLSPVHTWGPPLTSC